ncbi:MAG TPA: hypothetical protein DCS24_03745 [Erythrobacter sp.]|nr:hypothetical protein [Erythrobacter sp.]
MKGSFRLLLANDEGVAAIEYAILLCLVTIGLVISFGNIGINTSSLFEKAHSAVQNSNAEQSGREAGNNDPDGATSSDDGPSEGNPGPKKEADIPLFGS